MSTRSKGHKRENEVAAMFQVQQFTTQLHGRRVNYIPSGDGGRRPVISDEDFFGAFDIVAIAPNKYTSWIQVCGKKEKIRARQEKIEKVPLPRSDVAMIFAWQGGQKRLDRRYKRQKRYLNYQHYNVYLYCFLDDVKDVFGKLFEVLELDEEKWAELEDWYWFGPIAIFPRVQLEWSCWICAEKLDEEGVCQLHPWAGNQPIWLGD